MPIFKNKNNKLTPIKEIGIKLEKDIQNSVESNIDTLFGYKFVSTEFALNNLRIDSLAFDEETKSFVIIEYKRDRSFSVIDQGFAYLSLLLNNKAEFILEINEKCKMNLRKEDIDWSQSLIIFIANSYTKYQQEAIGFQNLPIELWEYKVFEEGLVSLNEIVASENSAEIDSLSKNDNVAKVSREVKHYTLSDHFKDGWDVSKELWDQLYPRILDLDPRFVIKPVKYYIGFNIGNSNVVTIRTRTDKLLLDLPRVKPNQLKDPNGKVKYRKNSFKYYNKDISTYSIINDSDINYALSLVEQVYKKFTS